MALKLLLFQDCSSSSSGFQRSLFPDLLQHWNLQTQAQAAQRCVLQTVHHSGLTNCTVDFLKLTLKNID